MIVSNLNYLSSSIKKPLPLYEGICAGFPSPAEDYTGLNLDLNEFLVKHPAATFYVYAKGNSMINAGIYDGDLLIVGWGGTFGNLYSTVSNLVKEGKKVALAHFNYINPLPKNTETI